MAFFMREKDVKGQRSEENLAVLPTTGNGSRNISGEKKGVSIIKICPLFRFIVILSASS